MARRRKGGISLSLPPFLVPVLASADGGAGIACNGCRAPLDAGSARLRRIIFRPRRPKEPHHGAIGSISEFECHRCRATISIDLHFHRPTRLSALSAAFQLSQIREVPADAP
jgi:hypothetical protein